MNAADSTVDAWRTPVGVTSDALLPAGLEGLVRQPIDLLRLHQRVRELPALPQAVLEVLAVLRRDDSSTDACAERIARDQSMAARTLKLANSAFYGVAGRVATVRDAVHLLGRRTLVSLLTTAAVSAPFGPGLAGPHFTFARFWRHALGTALAAQAIARELGHDEELAFTAGLLHDIGQLALATHFPVEFGAVCAAARAADLPSRPAEEAVLGLDHAAVGTLIARHWRFPGHVAQAIAQHHTPQPDPGHPRSASLADVVHVADAIAHALDLSQAADEAVPDVDLAAWARLALSPPTCLRLFEHTESGVAALCDALGV